MKILVNFKQEISDRGEIAVSYLVQKIEERIYPEYPLREAVLHYPVNGGGKGFRPAMIQLITGAFGGDEKLAIPVAAAIEAVRDIKPKHVDLIDAKLWQRWAEVKGVLKYTDKKSEELFEDFIKQEYFQIISAVQTEIQETEFQSLYDVNVGDADEAT